MGRDELDEPDADELADDVRRKLLAALPGVIASMAAIARAEQKFAHDGMRHACLALLRLAPALLAQATRAAMADLDLSPGYHPSHTPERAMELLCRLRQAERKAPTSPEHSDDLEPAQEES